MRERQAIPLLDLPDPHAWPDLAEDREFREWVACICMFIVAFGLWRAFG